MHKTNKAENFSLNQTNFTKLLQKIKKQTLCYFFFLHFTSFIVFLNWILESVVFNIILIFLFFSVSLKISCIEKMEYTIQYIHLFIENKFPFMIFNSHQKILIPSILKRRQIFPPPMNLISAFVCLHKTSRSFCLASIFFLLLLVGIGR